MEGITMLQKATTTGIPMTVKMKKSESIPVCVHIDDPDNKHMVELPENWTHTDTSHDASVFLSYGGDGTLLRAAHKSMNSSESHVIVAGLNRGSVGFMANDVSSEYQFLKNVNAAYQTYTLHRPNTANIQHIQQRRLLDVTGEAVGPTYNALNEVTLHPTTLGKLFICNVGLTVPSMHIFDEELIYKGDGIIISTASGSTAYNLSAGGPLLTPCDSNIIISPLAPFSLASRPLVLPKDAVLTITIDTGGQLVMDGRLVAKSKKHVTIKLSDSTLALYKQDNFFTTIKSKLGWNNSIK